MHNSDYMTNDCIFCQIVEKKAPTGILFENDLVMALIDIRPVNEGHTLIIPKKHAELVEEIDSEEAFLELFRVGKKIQLMLKKKVPGITGFNYFIANGEDAGQEVFHVHLHIIPRHPEDGFGIKFGPNYGKNLTQEEIKNLRNKLLN